MNMMEIVFSPSQCRCHTLLMTQDFIRCYFVINEEIKYIFIYIRERKFFKKEKGDGIPCCKKCHDMGCCADQNHPLLK